MPVPISAKLVPCANAHLGGQVAASHVRVQGSLAAQSMPSVSLAQVEQVFVAKPPACQGQQATPGCLEALGDQLQGFIPGGRHQLAILAHQGLGQALGAFGVMVAKAALYRTSRSR